MVEGEMGHQEVNHRFPLSDSGPRVQPNPTAPPQLLHTPEAPSYSVPPMPNPVLQYPVQGTQFMPQQQYQQQQANVVYYAPPVPTTNFQPSPAGTQYVPVNMVQPPPRVTTAGTEGWTTGLFDCMDDPTNALITFCVPCLTFGQVAEIVDNGHTSCGTSALIYGAIACVIGCPFLISCTYRTKLRSRYDLVESPAPDWLVHCLCDCCALCQEYRELHNRGLDPSIGWHANVRLMQQQQVAMVAPPNQAMMGR